MPSDTRSRARYDRDRRSNPDVRARRAEEAQQAAYEMARLVRERVDARKDAQWRACAEANRRKVMTSLVAPAIPGVVILLVGIVVHLLLIVGVVLLLAAVALSYVSWVATGKSAVQAFGGLTLRDALSAGIVSSVACERYVDLAEQLCATLGVAVPELRVLNDPAANAISAGRNASESVVWLTSGLLATLERIELEGVLAHEMVRIKMLDSVAVAFELTLIGKLSIGLGGSRYRRWLEGTGRQLAADMTGVGVTRYPPGLLAALQRVDALAAGTRPTSVAPALATATGRAWFAPVGVDEPGESLADRIDVLSEL